MLSVKESIQSVFLQRVRSRLSPNISFVDELAELLNISRDSAYRRIRGETILSLEEAKILYDHFGISLDEIFSDDSRMVTFHRRVVNHKDYSIEKWHHSILKNLEYLNGFEQKKMIFSAKDIPVFHYYRLRELSTFKHFFWLKTLICDPSFERLTYKPDLVPHSLLDVAEKVWENYAAIPSIEIWNDEVVYDTLKQIEFYHQCGFFEESDRAAFLCDQLVELLELVKDEASAGIKAKGGSFDLFKNDILIADNTVFARMDDRRCVYVNQNALNLLLTFQEPFCEQTEVYLNNLLAKAIMISRTGERERANFFAGMKKKILAVKQSLG